MQKKLVAIFLVLTSSLCGGCLYLTQDFSNAIEPGSAPVTQPVVISQLSFVPPIELGPNAAVMLKGTSRGVMNFVVMDDLRPLKPMEDVGAMQAVFGNPWGKFEMMGVKVAGVSVIPTRSGRRYIRHGTVILKMACKTSVISTDNFGGCRVYEDQKIEMQKDIQLNLPVDAKAVCIGQITLSHANNIVTKVAVENRCPAMIKQVVKDGIGGLSAKDIQVRLAKIL